MAVVLPSSRRSSEVDELSVERFQFSHPQFAESTTPLRLHDSIAAPESNAHTSPHHLEHRKAAAIVVASTPNQTVYTRFTRRPILGHRTVSGDGLPAETPAHTTHLTHKASASISRWKRTGRIGLGPPKRAERQSLDAEDAEDEPHGHDELTIEKELIAPARNSRATTPSDHGSHHSSVVSLKSRKSVSPPAHSLVADVPFDDSGRLPSSIIKTTEAVRAPLTELPASYRRPDLISEKQASISRRTSGNDVSPKDMPDRRGRVNSPTNDVEATDTDNARKTYLKSPAIKPLLDPGQENRHQLQKSEMVPATVIRPLPVLQLSTQAPTAHREPIQAPPPRMTLDGPTSTAARKAKALTRIVMNGREYTKLDQIGKGGSSKVFRVMAPNGRIFALKRVDFEQADQATILGYKSEIDLLHKLSSSSGSERIIKLYDAEINDSKGRLLMLMEAGEIDLAHMLTKRGAEIPDFNFIRLFWRHMLEAVQAVHEQKIVHSDLKPANFLLVEGSLKLIDFGIAKAIGNDTTNIHRDQQVGTINYMSPEALSDTGANGGRLMKLGRASDVWSLGCILYQMVYGRTPFSHLTMIQKIQAIPCESHRIEFPLKAYPPSMANDKVKDEKAGRVVDGDILRVLRGCLERDQRQRLTIEQLLADPCLRPEDRVQRPNKEDSVAINLAQITDLLRLTVSQTREKTLRKETIHNTDIESLAKDFYDRLRWAT